MTFKEELIEENLELFGKYRGLVEDWCKRYDMCFVMEEFKDLFEKIEEQARAEAIREVEILINNILKQLGDGEKK